MSDEFVHVTETLTLLRLGLLLLATMTVGLLLGATFALFLGSYLWWAVQH